jgi:hypothetical protein
MKKSAVDLMEQIKSRPESFFVARSEGNYRLFLDLYEQVGYAPSVPDEIARWKERSRKTWSLQDSTLPGSYTGGLVQGQIVSAAGTLPMAKNILYGHSFCMIKTLDAAVTLFAQSLHSVDMMEAFPEIGYWAGSYAHRARFASQFQRPAEGAIPDQLELEVVRLLKPAPPKRCTAPLFKSEKISPDSLNWMSPLHREFFRELSSSHSALASIHGVTSRALVEVSTGLLKGAAITQSAPPEFTAISIFSWTWVFPAAGVVIDPEFVGALRSVPEIERTSVQIVLQSRGGFSLDKINEPVIPSFWVLTPRRQLGALRESIGAAFATLFDRYPEEDLARQAR